MSKKSRKNVGLIGLGIIGSRVANSLRLGGYHVYVWNRTPRAAPNFLASPRQVAELCDIIQIFVTDAQALFEVLEGMGDALTPSHVIVCNSTIGPEATIDAARMVQDRGAQFLDAPFTGSKTAAERRELVYYIGGEDKTFDAVEAVLKASSKVIVKIGKIGDAATVKVATNMIAAVTVQTLAEAYAIVKASGIAPVGLVEALKHHGVRSQAIDTKLAKMLDRDYQPHFSLKNMFKDVQLGIHIANSLDIDLPATTSTAGVMYGGLTRGWAEEDFSVLARTYQQEDQPPPLYIAPPAKAQEKAAPAPAPVTPPASVAPPTPVTAPAPKAPDRPAAPPPSAEIKEPAREPSVEELRAVGIKVPDAPASPPTPAPAPIVEKTASPAPVEQARPEPPKAAEPGEGSATTEVPKADAAPGKAGDATAPGASAGAKPPEPAQNANGVPGEPPRSHTPFVRIRRWFGTGAPN